MIYNLDFEFAMFADTKDFDMREGQIRAQTRGPFGDLAKIWLYKSNNYRWYHEKILVFWNPKAESKKSDSVVNQLAYEAEADIGGLLGLFSS